MEEVELEGKQGVGERLWRVEVKEGQASRERWGKGNVLLGHF